MKRTLALIVALIMALTCVSAFADTIYTKVAVDPDVAQEVLNGFGVPEEQLGMIDPIIALVNAIGVNVVQVGDGVQIDLDLNGEDAISFGVAAEEQGLSVASTLFPNYLVTVSQETIGQMMEQFKANMPGAGAGEGGMDMTAMTQMMSGYFTPWMEACAAAGKPGEAVAGEYLFDGYAFDTMVPITVDMAVINEATRKLLDSLLADPAAMAAIKGMAQGIAQSSGIQIDDADFEAQFKAGFEEWMAHFPETVNAEFYTNSSGSETFYMTGASIMKDSEDPAFTYSMLYENANNMDMDCMVAAEAPIEMGFSMHDGDIWTYYSMGEVYFGLALGISEGLFECDVYFMDAIDPLVSFSVAMIEGGERTLPVNAEGKTVLAFEDAMNDQTGAAVQGLLGDATANGLPALMETLGEQVPEFALLLSLFSGEGMAS